MPLSSINTQGVKVAPRVGAWIETATHIGQFLDMMSHPVWVRGLKPLSVLFTSILRPSHPVWVRGLKLSAPHLLYKPLYVAPRVGAWIETAALDISPNDSEVAPRVGAWIETIFPRKSSKCLTSHPVWVRGLKLLC